MLNSACMVHDHVRNSRNDIIEAAHLGQPIGIVSAKTGYLPPCQRDANAFGQERFSIRHVDPLEGRNLPSVDEDIPPFSCCPTPYRWMLEGNFRDICEEENLLLPSRHNMESSPTWVMEDNRQRAMLGHFWGKLQKGKSLIFYYCNRGNAVDDSVNRLLVGVSRIAEIGDQVYFGRRHDRPGNFPVWSRRITSGMPNEGVRIPYQEYIALGKDLESIVCLPPNGMNLPFSYDAEHLTDGQAVSAILAILKSIERVRIDGYVVGKWDTAIAWCNAALDEVWGGRGAFPGIGSLLRYLGCTQGHAYHATVLRDLERKGCNPWDRISAILQGDSDPDPDQYREGLLAAAKQWRQENAPALLEELHKQILAAQAKVLPKSVAGKAAKYTLTLWKKLTLFLEYPELELSNNLAENSMRPIAIGRRNWIHLGSKEAGPKVAAIFSIVESCRRIGLPIREYLAAVLPGLSNRSIQSLDQLTPAAYAASKAK